MIAETQIKLAADQLWHAAQIGKPCSPVRELIGAEDIQLAYNVQKINIDRRIALGENRVGCKIGLTSLAVQKQLGVDQPDFGILTDAMRVAESEAIPWRALLQPKAEAEIAFVLAKDLFGSSITLEQLKQAIDYAVASIEVVGSRVEGWNIKITDTVADNASASHFVLGSERRKLDEVNLEDCTMKLFRFGELVSEGVGKACLGNPLNAALWLAQTMNDLGTPLKAGDIILAGALGPMVAANPGDVFEAKIEGFGSVSVKFASV